MYRAKYSSSLIEGQNLGCRYTIQRININVWGLRNGWDATSRFREIKLPASKKRKRKGVHGEHVG